jgi:dipeptidyl aminopeptidase/acylaminoacyl peptidase
MPVPNRRAITAEDLYEFKLISTPRISPDGEHVIFALQRVDQQTEKKISNLWVVSTRGDSPRQFTYGDQNDFNPRWSPDSDQIAFLSDRADKDAPAKIFIVPTHGGEARLLTEIKGKIEEFSWSPDGKKLVCRVRKTDQEALQREKDERSKELGVVARHYDRVYFKLDDDGYLPQERWHLWVVDTQTGMAEQITDHPVYDEQWPTWSPDGKWIAFTSNRNDQPDLNPDAIDVFVMPTKGGEPRKVNTPFGEKMKPSFSPNGEWIAYYGKEGEGDWYKNYGLWIVPVGGSDDFSQAHNLTDRYDLHVSPAVINDLGQPEMMPPAWSKDGKTLYFQAALHGSSVLKSISSDGDNLQTVIDEGGAVGSFSFSQDHKQMAYFYGEMDDPGQIHVRDVQTETDRQLTNINSDLLSAIDLGEMEEVWIQGPANNDLQGWILKPPGFDPAKKYASILEIHGGPLTQYGNFFMHEFYYLAAQGYVVHFCNPRGGRGYGEEHAKAIWGGWGSADYEDLMAWTDFVSQKPYIDAKRMGVTGGSYGGYMTVWIIGHTDRYKAAVAQRCVSNLVSLWGSSDMNWVFEQVLNDRPPFEDIQKFWDHSPMKYIGSASTPTLIIHSENDLRCPIEQGEQVFVALQRLGVDSEMVRFPDEFHGLSRTGRTDRRIVRLNDIRRWFDKYLKDK